MLATAAIASVAWPALALLIDGSERWGSGGWNATGPALPQAESPRASPSAAITPVPGAFLGTGELLARSLGWILAIGALALLLGWPLGVFAAQRWERARRVGASFADRARGAFIAFLLAMPLAVPGYLVFWSLWHQVEPTSIVGRWLMERGAAVALREGVLVIALALWTAAPIAWCVIAHRVARPEPTAHLRRLDGGGFRAALAAAWRHDRLPLAAGSTIVLLALLGESVSFDLAQVRTYGFELRSLDASGASAGSVLAAGWPAVLLASILVLLAMALITRLGRRMQGGIPRERRAEDSHLASRMRLAMVVTPLGWLGTLLVAALPIMLLVEGLLATIPREAGGGELATFLRLYARPAANSMLLALAAGALIGTLGVGVAIATLLPLRRNAGGNRPLRMVILRAVIALLALGAALPATLLALALEAGWNRPVVGPLIYDNASILLLAALARFGIVGCVIGLAAAALVGERSRLLIALDDPRSPRALWRVARPALITAFLVSGFAGTALSFSEIIVTGRVQPPGLSLLASSILNAIHYQQPETVLVASSAALLIAASGSAIAVLRLVGIRRLRGARSVAALPGMAMGTAMGTAMVALLLAGAPLAGCERRSASADPDRYAGIPPIPAVRTFGTPGFGPGQFRVPRSVAFDEARGRFFVIDKSARIQRMDRDGNPQLEWRMPEFSIGMPVGLSVHPDDGRVFVADTHYHRIMVFSAEGVELARFGRYGQGPGEFIYPTDIAFGNDGRIYIGEYGGNDRVQIFSPTFEQIGTIGSFGGGEGQFSRPQGLAFDRSANELYVADSNNHRVVVYDPDGRRLRQFGTPGTAQGELAYPRGIVFCGDGTILLVEFGNHRVQRFVAAPGERFGVSLGVWGGMSTGPRPQPIGEAVDVVELHREITVEPGRLQYPWDMAGVGGHVMLLDSSNNRVMLAKIPS
jgi:DNA-binding beta-propeller fold protein YncE